MTATILDGKTLARTIREQVRKDVQRFRNNTGKSVGLATILVGEDPASEVYVTSKRRLSRDVGIQDYHRHLPTESTQDDVAEVIDDLVQDPQVSGILLQLPLPNHLNSAALLDRIPWYKDVDGLNTTSAGRLARNQPGLRPCTPSGVLSLLHEADIPLSGAHAVVVGRSELVGRPLAQMLLQQHATVTVAHSRTTNLTELTRSADILIAAAGVSHLIGEQHVSSSTAVVDVGIHRTETGLAGDVDFNAVQAVASRITPVPGGVGPMTIAELLRNTLRAAEYQH